MTPFLSPIRLLLAGVLLAGLLIGCGSSSGTVDDAETVEERVERLEAQLDATPDDPTVQRDLGALYLRQDRTRRAEELLTQAHSALPNDPKTLYMLGLVREKMQETTAALDLYRQYTDVPNDSPFRDRMQGRFEQLRRHQAQQEIRRRIQQEEDVSNDTINPEAVAVFPFDFAAGNSRYAPLGRGLAEIILTDLTHVRRLTVVERLRLQALRRELELAQTEYVDPETAPRIGRLISAGRLLGGSYTVDNDELSINALLTDLQGTTESDVVSNPAVNLSQLFDVSDEIVFDLVDRLGIELTAEERAAIEQDPTQNLEAFLAYSRALEEEDRGNYRQAADLYRNAVRADPSFQQASQGATSTSAAGQAEASVDAAAQAATGGITTSLNLKQLRLNNMGVGGRASSGQDDRQPAAESAGASGTTGPLQDPPDVPDRSGQER